MIAFFMVFSGVPVYAGLFAMLAAGLLLAIVVQDYVAVVIHWINDATNWLYHMIPLSWTVERTEQLPGGYERDHYTWFGDIVNSVYHTIGGLPTEGNGLIVTIFALYLALELLSFIVCVVAFTRRKGRTPTIREDF